MSDKSKHQCTSACRNFSTCSQRLEMLAETLEDNFGNRKVSAYLDYRIPAPALPAVTHAAYLPTAF